MLEPTRLVLNGVELDLAGGMLRGADGRDIPLRPQSLAVLKHLAANANRVVGKDELLDAVWPGIAVTENSLSQCISEIRKALGDERQDLLKTVARRGYRFDLPPGIPPRASALGNEAIASPAGIPAAPPSRQLLAIATAAAVAVALIAAVAAYFWVPVRDPSVPDTLSIAVLPFDNLSEEATFVLAIAACATLTGIMLLVGELDGASRGDLIALISAAFYALWMVELGRHMRLHGDAATAAFVQFLLAATVTSFTSGSTPSSSADSPS